MTSATIKLFLPHGNAKSLRTAEISNWTGKAVAAPRTELDALLVGTPMWIHGLPRNLWTSLKPRDRRSPKHLRR
jgi:hypothetical protein